MDFFTLPYVIALMFFTIAFIYSSVGLGGGSAYTALLVILSFSQAVIPMISLSLNIIVTSVGSYNFIKNKLLRFRLIAPFLLTSIPMAFLGGMLNLPNEIFQWILVISLLFVAMRIYFWKNTSLNLKLSSTAKLLLSLVSGSILGFVAGTVGIGGGVYLIPLIIIFRLGTGKEAAACGAVFVFINSIVGITARLQYNSINLLEYIPLVVAVLLGGLLGSYLGALRYSARTMEKILGLIILIAIIAVARKLID